MECVCVGIDPKEVLQTVSMENVSSAVYLDNLDDCLRYISGQSVDIVFMRSDFPREDKKDFTLKLQRISPATVVMDVNEHTDDFMLIKPIPKENMEDTLKLLKPITEEKRKDIFIRTFGRFVVSETASPAISMAKPKKSLHFWLQEEAWRPVTGKSIRHYGKTVRTATEI